MAGRIIRPAHTEGRPTFEVDELWTYIGRKDNEYWIAYALNRVVYQNICFLCRTAKQWITGGFRVAFADIVSISSSRPATLVYVW